MFVVGFVLFALIRTGGDHVIGAKNPSWKSVISYVKLTAELLLIAAICAAGLNTRIRQILNLTLKPLIVGFFAAITVGVVSYVLVLVLNPWIEKAFNTGAGG